ncbi:HamA C-terminal domain-containing protein [Phaeobacter gallaeciensis]|uniref:HamA C-terminal domain-containing protein n=1 Tax=Phaeobacter gallaeciensis TaxID=60890 RepID=UPI00237F51BD|nr:DUF1837 domain-containing protein [Phaeobacter gallaeciensis]MDE4140955.1 DUF1837 domain-containing protein [Phaeobacter gallaeciensis]MDE4149400.1 DUF1837 domain-containing protein [Phaeobacter gallaeciensis]MDE4153407.1 DUF1837 domain-containing protein [Phaeobacter gallaeciensis]MDE4228796.1 DUF1837 domain-containing protein [Phaeobacter gallaeciensis]MDE4257871.1 DUF1837 domain-containing protein [Phaeobacter gallaeciensis]
MSNPYELVPKCILTRVTEPNECLESYCAGFELSEWRCSGLADNLIEWIIDYALKSDELRDTNHTNTFVRLKQAASRVYTSEKYERRGEVGEIAAHAVCRTYFNTIPVAARVNYLSASNDPVKAFDLVHVRYVGGDNIELWLGEAKFFKSRNDAIKDAIASINSHITAGFLKNEKLLLGPQVSSDIPHSAKIKKLLSAEASLDELIASAVFPVLIAANSDAASSNVSANGGYSAEVADEMNALWDKLKASGLTEKIGLKLIYVPLGDKDSLNKAFDDRLKGLQIV